MGRAGALAGLISSWGIAQAAPGASEGLLERAAASQAAAEAAPAPFLFLPRGREAQKSRRGTKAPLLWHLNKKQLLEAERGTAQGKGPSALIKGHRAIPEASQLPLEECG